MSRAASGRPGLERYQPIMDDWKAFLEACTQPLPTVIRTNTLRSTPGTLRRRIEAYGLSASPLSWEPSMMTVDGPAGRLVEHWLGHFYVQEAVQAIPVRALAPRPGETILDLCAAPGGKSTDIAARMDGVGCLIANEPDRGRQQSLFANLRRLGAWNVSCTGYRGEGFPLDTSFDRVLLDAPCSAEGTLRKESALRHGAFGSTIRRLAKLQRRLIERAYDLLRPGGVLVYSTCTFAPEENEATIAHLLRVRDARIAPVELPFPAACGLTEWNDESFPESLRRCARIYPHHLDSGGGFVARIERPIE